MIGQKHEVGECQDCESWVRWPPPPRSGPDGYCNHIGWYWKTSPRLVATPGSDLHIKVGDVVLLTGRHFGCMMWEPRS